MRQARQAMLPYTPLFVSSGKAKKAMTSNHSSLMGMIIGVLLLVGCASPPSDSSALPASLATPRAAATAASNVGAANNANSATAMPANAEPLASPQQPVGSASPSTGKPVDAARPANPQVGTATDEAAYTGFYEVVGALPADMKPFGNFMIRSVTGGKVSGAVVPDEGEVFEFTSATLANGNLSFTTAKNAGVSYSFEGAFTATPPFGGNKKTPVIEGTLKKYRNAQAAGQADLKFYFDAGGGE